MPSVEITTMIPSDVMFGMEPITVISQTTSLTGPPGSGGGGSTINGGPPVTFDITDDGNFMPSGGGPDGSWYFD